MIENKIERITNANFNSIKVRLEPGDALPAAGGFLIFQFHKGAIRTINANYAAKVTSISIP